MTKQIPQGYKQTKVGIIPEEWEMLTINQLVNMDYLYKPLDGNHGDIHPKSSDFVPSGIPFIMANNIKNGVLDLENCSFIAKNQADKLQKGFSIIGDVLLTHKGTVGNVVMVKNLDTDYIMLTPQVTYYRVKDHSQLSNHYIFQYFLSKTFQQKLQEIAGGGTRAYIGITEQRNLPFILPPLKEQEKIAEILSTWDDAITKQEQLIEQKQVFKKGLMQQIFSQKIRFKDDNGNDYPAWQEKKMGDVGTFRSGTGFSEEHQGGLSGTPFYKVSDMNLSGNSYEMKISNNYVSQELIITQKYNVINEPSIIFAKVGAAIFLERKRIAQNFLIDNNMMAFIPNGNIKFFKTLLDTISFSKLAQTGALPSYNASDLSVINLHIPCINEQTKIADFVTNINDEITTQTEILSQLKLQKQSLMQKLLTGQVRTLK